MRVCARPRPANGRGVDRIGVRGRSDSGLPGARQAGALEDVFDAQASLAASGAARRLRAMEFRNVSMI